MFSQVQPDPRQADGVMQPPPRCRPTSTPPTLSTLSEAGLMPHSAGQPESHLNITGGGGLPGRVTSLLSAPLALYQHLLS